MIKKIKIEKKIIKENITTILSGKDVIKVYNRKHDLISNKLSQDEIKALINIIDDAINDSKIDACMQCEHVDSYGF